MIVNDFHILWSIGCPTEANPELIVDSNAVLAFAIALERFQAVPGWRTKEIERFGGIQLRQLSCRNLCNRVEPLALSSLK